MVGSFDFQEDRSIDGPVSLVLLKAADGSSEFEHLDFSVSLDNFSLSRSFDNASDARLFFDDRVLSLGHLDGAGSSVFSFSYSFTASTIGSRFEVPFALIAVPEPCSFTLLLAAALGSFFYRAKTTATNAARIR